MMTISISPLKSDKFLTSLSPWTTATWQDYLTHRDSSTDQRIKLYYYHNQLLIQMGKEGINHACISDLFIMLFAFWFAQHPEQIINTYGGCLLEKPSKSSAAPDLVVYLKEDYPQWQQGESRYINLDQWRVPNLVGEISDTTLATDLDEKKHLYADLKIPEYWVIDVQAQRVFAFQLQENGTYQECESSLALKGLPIYILEETLTRLARETNSSAANWFAQKISSLQTD